jgi:hypothetical protein
LSSQGDNLDLLRPQNPLEPENFPFTITLIPNPQEEISFTPLTNHHDWQVIEI